MMLSLSVPANGWLSSPFGPRNIPTSPFHHGIDYGWLEATKDFRIFAAAPGIVSKVFSSTSMGHCIEVDHGGGFRTRYCHLADRGLVNEGDRVVRRQHIGTMGATGAAASGQRHLHFELWQNGNRIDPAPYMTGTAGGDLIPIGEEEEENMPRYIWTDDNAAVNGIGYALFDTGYVDGVIVTGDKNEADRLSRVAADRSGVPGAPAWVTRPEFNQQCADATWLWRKYAAKPGGGGSDNGPVLEAVEGVSGQVRGVAEQVAALPKAPSAAENGAAARAAIVK